VLPDQVITMGCRYEFLAVVGLLMDCRPDGFLNASQERFEVSGRRLNEKLVAVLAYVLSETIEPSKICVILVFSCRELKTSTRISCVVPLRP
jgi:hypothetical protein